MARCGKRLEERVVTQRVGIGVGTLERWRAEALALPAGAAADRPWSAAARLDALIVTASLDEASRHGWCRERGINASELED